MSLSSGARCRSIAQSQRLSLDLRSVHISERQLPSPPRWPFSQSNSHANHASELCLSAMSPINHQRSAVTRKRKVLELPIVQSSGVTYARRRGAQRTPTDAWLVRSTRCAGSCGTECLSRLQLHELPTCPERSSNDESQRLSKKPLTSPHKDSPHDLTSVLPFGSM
jgi:hypothetical protein